MALWKPSKKRSGTIIMIKLLETLLKDKRVQIKDGTFLECAEQINLKLYHKSGYSVVEFGSPGVYLKIENIGLKLLSVNRPRVNRLILGPQTVKLVLDKFMDFEFKRSELEAMMK